MVPDRLATAVEVATEGHPLALFDFVVQITLASGLRV
jgi:hypothetical protein